MPETLPERSGSNRGQTERSGQRDSAAIDESDELIGVCAPHDVVGERGFELPTRSTQSYVTREDKPSVDSDLRSGDHLRCPSCFQGDAVSGLIRAVRELSTEDRRRVLGTLLDEAIDRSEKSSSNRGDRAETGETTGERADRHRTRPSMSVRAGERERESSRIYWTSRETERLGETALRPNTGDS